MLLDWNMPFNTSAQGFGLTVSECADLCLHNTVYSLHNELVMMLFIFIVTHIILWFFISKRNLVNTYRPYILAVLLFNLVIIGLLLFFQKFI